MRNKIALIPVLIFVFVFVGTAGAVGKGAVNQEAGGNQAGQQVEEENQVKPAEGAGNGQEVKNQNQIQEQNKGEEQQIRQEVREEEGTSKTIESLGQTIKEIKDLLPEKVQLQDQIQTRLREVLDEQVNLQLQVQQRVKQLESRGKALKFFIGPNYQAVSQLERHIEDNNVRIQELTSLKEQAANQGEATALQQTIEALNKKNTALENAISNQTKTFSLFGWFTRLFSR